MNNSLGHKVVFVNGYWRLFNNEKYEVEETFYLRKDAVEALKKVNRQSSNSTSN